MSSLIPSTSRTHFAWFVVVLLMPVALLNYLDRQMLASMKFSVMSDIASIGSEENWGLMLGQFKWVYAAFSLLGGYLADRFPRRFTICASVFVWSVVTWWTAHVNSFNELMIARSLMGISEALYMPAALALIADYHSGRTRSRAIGLHQLAIYCGVIAGGYGGYIADAPDLGWRFAFSACGVAGMLYAVPLMFLLRGATSSTAFETRPIVSPRRVIKELLTDLSFIILVLYFTLPALAGWIIRDWMPAILKQQFGIGQGQAGVAATMWWPLAAMIGAIAGGALADCWMRYQRRGRIFASALGTSLIVLAIFGVGAADSLNASVVCLSLFGLGWGFFDCNNMPILSQVVRPELRATGYGIMNFVSISCGGLADWGFGVLRDRQVPLNAIFGAFASVGIVSIVLVLLIRPKRELLLEQQLVPTVV